MQRKRTGAYLSLYFIQGFSHGLQRDTKRGFLIFVNLTCQISRQEGNIPIEEKSYMQKFCPSQTDMVWYNVRVPHMRDALIFDIGPVTRDERRLEFSLPSHRPEATGRARSPSAPHPATSGTRNSVLGLVAKPLTFHNEKPNTMVRRVCNHAACPLFSFFVKVLRGTCHEAEFRGCAAFFSSAS